MKDQGLSKRVSRAGVVLAAVLVSLLVVALLGSELIKATVARHRQAYRAEQRQQSFWLTESAVQRAMHALTESPDYDGETWQVPGETLGTGLSGVAVISVESVDSPGKGKLIRVEGYYPDDPTDRISYEREVFVEQTDVEEPPAE
jgi:hypothetical protein